MAHHGLFGAPAWNASDVIRWAGATPPVEDTRGRVKRLWQDGCVNLRTFVTHHFPLQGVADTVRMGLKQPGEVLGAVTDVPWARLRVVTEAS